MLSAPYSVSNSLSVPLQSCCLLQVMFKPVPPLLSRTLWKMALPSAAVRRLWRTEYGSMNIQMCSWTTAPSRRWLEYKSQRARVAQVTGCFRGTAVHGGPGDHGGMWGRSQWKEALWHVWGGRAKSHVLRNLVSCALANHGTKLSATWGLLSFSMFPREPTGAS